MAIQFVLEDGTGLANSTTYVSVEEFQQYWTNKGVDYTDTDTYPVATIQAWLNEATQYADLTYNWGGTIADDDQALLVPRIGWVDVYGRSLDDSVPTYLKYGVSELAGIRHGSDPESSLAEGIASKSFGNVSVSYRRSSGQSSISYPTAEKWFNKMDLQRGLRNWPS